MSETSRLRTRTLVLTGVLVAVHLALVVRLGHLQLVRGEELSRVAERQYSKTIPLKPKRGPIVDRHGLVLAVSSGVESVFADPRRMADPGAVAARLAPWLGERATDLQERLETDRPFVWLKRKLPPAAVQPIRALGLPGIGVLPESLRFYPNRELAAHVLGFEGVDDRGLEGVELSHDRLLAGDAGLALVERDARGRDVSTEPRILKAPVPGQGLALTLDARIQYVAERALDAAWRQTGAKSGMILAMDSRTGEILAMAIRPTFNPDAYQAATSEQWRNRGVTDPFEHGSTFKAILAAAALEEGVAAPEDRFYGEQGAITVANRTIHDSEAVRVALVPRGPQVLVERRLDQDRPRARARAVLQARHGVRVRRARRLGPPGREPGSPPPQWCPGCRWRRCPMGRGLGHRAPGS